MNPDNAGFASARFASSQDLQSLVIGNGGSASVLAGGSSVINTRQLTIGAIGRLDIADNPMIVDYSGASPIASIQTMLGSGYNGGA